MIKSIGNLEFCIQLALAIVSWVFMAVYLYEKFKRRKK